MDIMTTLTKKQDKANGIKLASGVTLTIRDSSSTSNGELTVTNNVSMVMNNDVSDGNMAAINTRTVNFVKAEMYTHMVLVVVPHWWWL